MKIRKGSLSYLVLLSLEAASQAVQDFGLLSYSSQMKALRQIPSRPSEATLSQTLRRLKNNLMVEYERRADGERILVLTSLGQEFLKKDKGYVWDGKYRVVIWDIPESKRVVRNLLRRRLKDWGFRKLQNSVWVSRQNVTGQLRRLVDEMGMQRWVWVIESDDEALGKVFMR